MTDIITAVCLLRIDPDKKRALNPRCCRGFTMTLEEWERSSKTCPICGYRYRRLELGDYKEFDL